MVSIDLDYSSGQRIDVGEVAPGVRDTPEEKLIYAVEVERPPARWRRSDISHLLTIMAQIMWSHHVGATFEFGREVTNRRVVLMLRLAASEQGLGFRQPKRCRFLRTCSTSGYIAI